MHPNPFNEGFLPQCQPLSGPLSGDLHFDLHKDEVIGGLISRAHVLVTNILWNAGMETHVFRIAKFPTTTISAEDPRLTTVVLKLPAHLSKLVQH
jgi:hypothetical protein